MTACWIFSIGVCIRYVLFFMQVIHYSMRICLPTFILTILNQAFDVIICHKQCQYICILQLNFNLFHAFTILVQDHSSTSIFFFFYCTTNHFIFLLNQMSKMSKIGKNEEALQNIFSSSEGFQCRTIHLFYVLKYKIQRRNKILIK